MKYQRWLPGLLVLVIVLLGGGLFVGNSTRSADAEEAKAGSDKAGMKGVDERDSRHRSTADHTNFEELNRDFKTGPEVTAACLECHTEAARQIMDTSHWTWICPRAKEEYAQRHGEPIGKAQHVINNFCIALGSNEPRCTSCHAGYGWKDKNFDFNQETNVDCLVCHDTTGSYRKYPTAAGHPNYEPKEWPKGSGKMWQPPDLKKIARNVGQPSRDNCGTCHFFGGGGEGVKHGDMDQSLSKPSTDIDVHMGMWEDGVGDFNCTECHTTKEHKISGRCFDNPAYESREYVQRGMEKDKNLLACESCHSASPHKDQKLNDHTDKVSCQACHIPTIAPARPTKMWWDWSMAGKVGKKKHGKKAVKVALENYPETKVLSFHIKKGEFIWAQNIEPEYRWYNGSVLHTFQGDKIDDKTPGRDAGFLKGEYDRIDLDKPIVAVNQLVGSYDDPQSRIWPVKIHRGKQPYDPVNKSLVIPKLFGKKGSGAFWADGFDWAVSIEKGMNYVGEEYSGEYDFIQTEMSWPLSHMVRPAENAVQCAECHHPEGRLKALTGFYMPGRDRSQPLDTAGIVLILLTLIGVVFHGIGRLVLNKRSAS